MDPLAKHVEDKAQHIKTIFNMVAQIIYELNDHDKIFIKDLCVKIGSQLQPPMDRAEIYPLIRFFIESCPGVYLLKGRTGGLYKGIDPKK